MTLIQNYSNYHPPTGWLNQFSDYQKIPFNLYNPIICKYFTLVPEILLISDQIKTKYRIDPDKSCGVYYRGTDKYKETQLADYESYHDKMNQILEKSPKTRFLLLSDEELFIRKSVSIFPNCVEFTENQTTSKDLGLHNENTGDQNYQTVKYYIALIYYYPKVKI